MTAEIETRLRNYGNALLDETEPVTFEALAERSSSTSVTAGSAASPRVASLPPVRDRRAMLRVVGAAAAAVLLVLGLVAILGRPGVRNLPPTDGTSTAEGALTFPVMPAGWKLDDTMMVEAAAGPANVTIRVYATPGGARLGPNSPVLAAVAFATGVGNATPPSGAQTVTVQGVLGTLTSATGSASQSIRFELEGRVVAVTAINVPTPQLLDAAEHTHLAADGSGAMIDTSGLTGTPGTMTQRAIGRPSENWFISQEALAHPVPSAHWSNGGTTLWFMSLRQDPSLADLPRLDAASITSATVHGRPADVIRKADDLAYASITWNEGDRTYYVGSRDLTDDQLVAMANSLEPASAAQWAQMLADTKHAAPSPVAVTTVSSATPSVFDTGASIAVFIRPGATQAQIDLAASRAGDAFANLGLSRLEQLSPFQSVDEARRVIGGTGEPLPDITTQTTAILVRIWLRQPKITPAILDAANALKALPNVMTVLTDETCSPCTGYLVFGAPDPDTGNATTLAPPTTP